MRPAPSRLKRRLLFITLGTLIAAGAATAVLMGDATPEVAEAAEDTAPAGGEAPRVVTTAPTEDGLVTTTSEPELLGTNLGGITPTWTHVSTAPAYEWSYDVVATAQRTLYVTGYVQDAGQDLQVAKYVDGTQRWARSYAGPAGGSDWGEVIAARSGRIYTAGSRQTKWGDQDLLLIRWDGNGNRVWTRAYDSGSRSTERAVDVAVDGDGNVIVVGSSHRPATGWDWVVVSYRADGTRRWVQRYDGPS
ncbi:MAG: hypothetical protein JW767_04385, partial [Thermoleophilia bacterium]|nr:hypothetical protein [Thermoleophilia bacterium]